MATAKLTVPVQVRVTVGSDVMDLEDRELFTVLRRKHDLRQEDVAAEAGTNQPWLSRWERGKEEATPERLESLWTSLLRMVSTKRASEGTAA